MAEADDAVPAIHPLLTPEAQDAIAELRAGGLTDEEIFAQVAVYDASEVTEDGVITKWSVADFAAIVATEDDAAEHDVMEDAEAVEPWLGAEVSELVAAVDETTHTFVATLQRSEWDTLPTVVVAQSLAMIAGTATTSEDLAAVRASIIADRADLAAEAGAMLAEEIVLAGGHVVDVASRTPQVTFEASGDVLSAISVIPGLGAIQVPHDSVDNAGYSMFVGGTLIDGLELEDLIQSTQFYNLGYSGGGVGRLAMAESDGDLVFYGHPGFNSAGGSDRFENCTFVGTPGDCEISFLLSGMAHPTATASVLIGDLTDGQDPAIVGLDDQRKRSGVARNSWGLGVTNDGLSIAEQLDASGYEVHIVNVSSGWTSDPLCEGRDVHSLDFNSLFEDGHAMFNSAGNYGHLNAGDCTLSSPAAAIGAFAVGAYVVDASDEEIIYDEQSRGGTFIQGRGRTIIGLAAPSGLQYPYAHFDRPVDAAGIPFLYGAAWSENPPVPGSFCCTSSSTPVVAGSAQLYRDLYLNEYSTLIDDPGIMYANMLLWGDRTQEVIALATEGYDDLWGAGKLRLRAAGVGLDGPARWGTGRTCVPANGEFVHVLTLGGPLSADVDVMRIVVWWYDHRHDGGTDNDKLRLRIEKRLPPSPVWSLHRSTESDDNRLRLHEDYPPADYEYRFKVQPVSVTSDVEGCGNNSAFVHWAYFWEDSDREPPSLAPIRPENDPE